MKVSKQISRWLGPVVLPVVLALSVVQPGCIGAGGPSTVGQGQAYRSGDPTFDQFFDQLHELQIEMAKAPEQEKQHRIALAKKLGMEIEVEEEAPPSAVPTRPASPAPRAAGTQATPGTGEALGQSAFGSLPGVAQFNALESQVNRAKAQVDRAKGQLDAARQQADALGALGSGARSARTSSTPAVTKKVVRPPAASLIARTFGKKAENLSLKLSLEIDRDALEDLRVETKLRSAPDTLDGERRQLADALHDTARSELELYVKMEKAKQSLERLAQLAATLDASVDSVFKKSGMGKKAEVRKNLEDARQLIALMQARAKDVSAKAKEVADELGEVAKADLIEPPPAPPENEAVAEKAPPTPPPSHKSTKAPKAQPLAKPPSTPNQGATRAVAATPADFEP